MLKDGNLPVHWRRLFINTMNGWMGPVIQGSEGRGYYHGVARILAVADVVESMASHRPYRPTLGIDAGGPEEIAE